MSAFDLLQAIFWCFSFADFDWSQFVTKTPQLNQNININEFWLQSKKGEEGLRGA